MSFLRKYWIELAILFVLLLMITAAWLGEFCQASERVQQEVLRLHILAASDSDEDQQRKLAVRDRLLKESERWFSISAMSVSKASLPKSLPKLKLFSPLILISAS